MEHRPIREEETDGLSLAIGLFRQRLKPCGCGPDPINDFGTNATRAVQAPRSRGNAHVSRGCDIPESYSIAHGGTCSVFRIFMIARRGKCHETNLHPVPSVCNVSRKINLAALKKSVSQLKIACVAAG
jgi:hypothetical protein